MVEVSVAYQSMAFPVALKSATIATSISQKVWFVSVVVGGSSIKIVTVTFAVASGQIFSALETVYV